MKEEWIEVTGKILESGVLEAAREEGRDESSTVRDVKGDHAEREARKLPLIIMVAKWMS